MKAKALKRNSRLNLGKGWQHFWTAMFVTKKSLKVIRYSTGTPATVRSQKRPTCCKFIILEARCNMQTVNKFQQAFQFHQFETSLLKSSLL